MAGLDTINFGSGSESDDDVFNPVQAIDSDDESNGHESRQTINGRFGKPGRGNITGVGSGEHESDLDAEAEGEDLEDGLTREFRRKDSMGENGDIEEEVDEEDNRDDVGDDDEVNDEVDDEDDDGDGEEEDDDDSRVQAPPVKKRKRDPRLQFIDAEAEVDDEEDEDEFEDEDYAEDAHPDDLLDLPTGGALDDRQHRELDRQRELLASMDAEKQVEELKRRYGRKERIMVDASALPRRLLLPTVDDPSIWLVKCREGKEKAIIQALMRRYQNRLISGEPLPFVSVFMRGGVMSGYIYIEALRQSDVLEAVRDLSDAYPRTKCELIHINEMPGLLRIAKTRHIENGEFVRVKKGLYAGDLAQVDDVDPNSGIVTLRMVPRLTYGVNEVTSSTGIAENSKRKRVTTTINGARPPQKLFNEHEARKRHAKFLTKLTGYGQKQYNYMNDLFIDGFLIKEMRIQNLQTDNVTPKLEEATMFAAGAKDGTENLDLHAIAASLKASVDSVIYVPGDMVEIFEGEQHGLCGNVSKVQGDFLTVNVVSDDSTVNGTIVEVRYKDVRKLFNVGDHVRVIGGSKYNDEAGMIVRIVDDRISLVTNASNQEITVFRKDLRRTIDTGTTNFTSKYDLHELVQLNQSTVACIVKVDRESIRVLDQDGFIKTFLPSEIVGKIDNRRLAVATDREGAEIRIGDTVKEYSGEQRQGSVIHIHRTFLFLLNVLQNENSGILVTRSFNVTTVAAKGARVNCGPDLTKMNPQLQISMNNSHPGNNNNSPSNSQSSLPIGLMNKSMGRDRLIGKTVSLRRGAHKGLIGIVVDTNDSTARVELHAKNKIVSVPRESLMLRDTNSSNSNSFGLGLSSNSSFSNSGRRSGPTSGIGAGAMSNSSYNTSDSHLYGMNGGPGASSGLSRNTDKWMGGRTPAVDKWMISRTPAADKWVGSRTPAADKWMGSRTPAAEKWMGGRTPAMPSGAVTPAWGGIGFTGNMGRSTAQDPHQSWQSNEDEEPEYEP